MNDYIMSIILVIIIASIIGGIYVDSKYSSERAKIAYETEGKYSYSTDYAPQVNDPVILVATNEPFIVVSTYSVRDAGLLVVLKNGDKTLTVSMNDIRKVKVVE